jgi:hypothetical protein
MDLLSTAITPDWEGLIRCIQRKGTPERVYHLELFLDQEVQETLCNRYGLLNGFDSDDAYFDLKHTVALQRFLGYDYVRCSLDGFEMPLQREMVADRHHCNAPVVANLSMNIPARSQIGTSLKPTPGLNRKPGSPAVWNGMKNTCLMICA